MDEKKVKELLKKIDKLLEEAYEAKLKQQEDAPAEKLLWELTHNYPCSFDNVNKANRVSTFLRYTMRVDIGDYEFLRILFEKLSEELGIERNDK